MPHFLRNSLSDSHFEIGSEIRHKDSKKDPLSLPTALSYMRIIGRACEGHRQNEMLKIIMTTDILSSHGQTNMCIRSSIAPRCWQCNAQSFGKEAGMLRLWKQVLILT